ncbi:MAG: hypothetical protein WCG78_02975 [Candidatus Omnitrophota bacterium]
MKIEAIKAIWGKMSKEEKTIAYVAMGFILLAFFDVLIFQAIMAKNDAINEQIRTQGLLIRKNLKILAQKDMIAVQEKEYAPYGIEGKSQEEEISSVLKEIEVLASQAGVVLIEVKPTNLKSEKIIKRYSISLSCEATMEQLARFMVLLQNSKVLFAIETYSITSKDKEKGIVRCALVISKIVVLSEPSSVPQFLTGSAQNTAGSPGDLKNKN